MSDVKYYALKRGEDFPSEFCVVDDSDGEPGEYRYYVPESENAKLRELCADMFKLAGEGYVPFEDADDWMARDGDIERRMRELGVEAD